MNEWPPCCVSAPCVCLCVCVRACVCASEWGVDASGLFAVTAFKTKQQQQRRRQRINTRHRRRCCERETEERREEVFSPFICIHVYICAVCFLSNSSFAARRRATCAYSCKHDTTLISFVCAQSWFARRLLSCIRGRNRNRNKQDGNSCSRATFVIFFNATTRRSSTQCFDNTPRSSGSPLFGKNQNRRSGL